MTETLNSADREVSREQIEANLRAWIHDLRTTDAKQGMGGLRTKDDGYCCLGRGALVLGLELVPLEKPYLEGSAFDLADRDEVGGQRGSTLGSHAARLGLTRDEETRCWKMNDGGWWDDDKYTRHTFAEISDYIEREILPRYAEPSVAGSVSPEQT